MAKKRSQSPRSGASSSQAAPDAVFFHDYTSEVPEKNRQGDNLIGLDLGCSLVWGQELVNEKVFEVEFLDLAATSSEIWQMLHDRADELIRFVQSGQLTARHRRPVGAVVMGQLYAMTLLGAIGHAEGYRAIIHSLREGNDTYRWGVLAALQQPLHVRAWAKNPQPRTFLVPATPELLQALREVASRDSQSLLMVIEAAERNLWRDLLDLISGALEHKEPRVVVNAAGAICVISPDPAQVIRTLQLLGQRELSEGQFGNLTWSLRLSGETQSAETIDMMAPEMRKWIDPYLRQQTAVPARKVATNIRFLGMHWLRRMFTRDDVPLLKDLVAQLEADDYTRQRLQPLLVSLDPSLRIAFLEESRNFELAAGELELPLNQKEKTAVLEAATRAVQTVTDERPLGTAAARILWEGCGSAGHEFVGENLKRFTTTGLHELAWHAEGLNAERAAAILSELKLAAPATNAPDKSSSGGPQPQFTIALDQLDAAGRYSSDDLETGVVPPQYPLLLNKLAEATAGVLKISRIQQKDAAPHRQVGPTVSYTAFGKKQTFQAGNTGDWYDIDCVVDSLHAVLQGQKIADRFHHVIHDGQHFEFVFGPPKTIAQACERLCLPLLQGDDWKKSENSFRRSCMTRVRRALKESRN